jgi:hypothetical protein
MMAAMMFTTLTSIAMIIVGGVLIAALVVAFAPFTFISEFVFSGSRRSGNLHLQWIHPRIAQLTYDMGERCAVLKVLRWKRVLSGGVSEDTGPQGTASEQHTVEEQSRKIEPSAERPGPKEYAGTSHEGSSVRDKGGVSGNNRTKQGPGYSAPKSKKKRAGLKSGIWQKVKKTLAVLRDGRVVPKSLRWCALLLRLCLRLLKFDHLRLKAKAGVADPAETGKIYGWYTAINNTLLLRRKNVDVRFEPCFSGEVLELEGSIGVRTSVARVGVPLVIALLTFPYLTVYFTWRRLKKVYNGTPVAP